MVKKIVNIMSNILIVFLVIIVLLVIVSRISYMRNGEKVPSIFGLTPMTVLTGSMQPYLEQGDVIITVKSDPSDIQVGDVITFKNEYEKIVTHRVTKVISENGKIYFKTKGDFNNSEDVDLVTGNDLIGKLFITLPKLGDGINYYKLSAPFILAVVFPLGLVLFVKIKKLKSKG